MNYIRAMIAAFIRDWKTTATDITVFFLIAIDVGRSAVIAWIVHQSGDEVLLTYIYVGVPLMAIWWMSALRIGWSIRTEIFSNTLDFTLISRTPLLIVLFGKTLAMLSCAIPAAVVSFLTVLLVSREVPQVAEITLIPFSLLLVLMGLALMSLFFALLMVLSGGRGGYFNAIMPFGALLSGFVVPVNRLPLALEVMARAFPASWAMDSVWQNIEGYESWWQVISTWAMSILLLTVWFGIIYVMSKAVEKRIRIKGSLGAD